MSAWIVSREHIDVLVKARNVYRGSYWTADFDATETGRMLWRENLRSVQARYPSDANSERPGPVGFADEDVEAYEYRDPRFIPTPGEIFKALACYEYQACEHNEWEDSDARKWCRGLADVVAGSLSEGPWGWDADEIRARLVAA